jgi:preprotein translocase subunit SecA
MNTHPPRPGPVQGLYPQRREADAPWLAGPWRRLQQCLPVPQAVLLKPAQRHLQAVRESQAAWAQVNEQNLALLLRRLRARLGRDGWREPALRAQALGCVASLAQRSLAQTPFDSQLLCAWWLLEGRLAEMATGEGKTLAVALAAAVAALAGVPVHVMTANDYLANRDAQLLAPLYQALGLSSGAALASDSPQERAHVYGGDVTHCTARQVAFDHLRDRQQLQDAPCDLQQRAARLSARVDSSPPLLLRGLCMALVDEADSLLIDEATMPLVLAEAVDDPRHRAWCFQALALARTLALGRHATVDGKTHQVQWTAEGRDQLNERAARLGSVWHNSHHRLEMVGSALLALHALKRDEDYLVRDGQVELLDAHTGRAAQGRVWSRGLHTLVEMKEGCKPSPQTRTSAQTSYQRFFARYLHLAGTSGTLAECRRELGAIYGLRVAKVPLRKPSQRVLYAQRRFNRSALRTTALAQRVRELQEAGRPVLVGVASVAQAQDLSQHLADLGIKHQVLDASHDAAEAAVVASAGLMGQVTVATAMAGRGTDIHLGPGVAERGGLHVIVCQDNHCARLDRQFIGRSARQGDPGSAEIWHALDAKPVSALGLHIFNALQQRLQAARDMRRRRLVLEMDLSWEEQLSFKHLHA